MPRSRHVLLALVFAAYCAATIAGAVTHEPWWDEAQAWLVARDAPLPDLLLHEVRYEGHPPLWYLLLAIPAKLGLPYASLKVVAVLAGMSSALLLLWGFPRVPLWIRVLAPFTLYVAYQYTIVARSYCLILPLLLLIARMYDRRHARPALFALFLILLSNVSVHGFASACGLAALFLFDVATERIPRPARRAFLTAAAAFILNGIMLVVLLWPPPDILSAVHLHSPFDLKRHSDVAGALITPMFWPPTRDETPLQAVGMVLSAMVALAILVFWFIRSRAGAPFALATLGAYAVALRYYSMWHEGIFFFLLLFGTVLAFERRPEQRSRWLDVAAQVVLVLLLMQHAYWGYRSLAYDIRWDATGSKRAAEFIKQQRLDRRQLYGTGAALVEIQPYFDANILDNYRNDGRAYWEWSSRNTWPYTEFTLTSRGQMERWFDRLVRDEPEYIVYGGGLLEDEIYAARLFRDPRYRRMASFGGYTFWKTKENWLITFHVLRRADRPPASAPRSAAR
ncbi:MAG TPA: hypothetical protein VND45_02480 [Thermoanaerobaculia bacterium]|nr:hypothetical protein [Thermoanaerobaculia bacterium]